MTAKAETDPGPRRPRSTEDGARESETDDGPPGARPMRADAVKNRQRILEAAEEIFATEGVSVPIDAVAERAGVGVGTLYRHFPTKEALFEAIVMARLEYLLEQRQGALPAPTTPDRRCSTSSASSPATRRPSTTCSTP